MTTTDEILRLARAAPGVAATVTEADVAAFRAAVAQGAGSAVVRALRSTRPAAPSVVSGPSPAAAPAPMRRDPAWTAWVTTTSAAATAGTPRPVWCAVFGAAVALTDPPESTPPAVAVTAAVTAGLGAAAIVESGLADWGGWSSGCVAAVIGAGVTAGLLLGLPEPRLRAAIGICATQAAGLRAAEGTDAFPLQVGKAAFNAVEAALLAQAGLTAPAEPLDGRRGLFALFSS